MVQTESASNGHRAHAQRRWHTQGSFCHRRASIWVFQEVAGDPASTEFARPVWGKKANSVEGLLENRHRHLCSKKSLNSCGLLNSLAKLLTISQHQSVNQSSFLKSIMLYKGPADYKTNLQLVYGVTKEALPSSSQMGVKGTAQVWCLHILIYDALSTQTTRYLGHASLPLSNRAHLEAPSAPSPENRALTLWTTSSLLAFVQLWSH